MNGEEVQERFLRYFVVKGLCDDGSFQTVSLERRTYYGNKVIVTFSLTDEKKYTT